VKRCNFCAGYPQFLKALEVAVDFETLKVLKLDIGAEKS